MRLGTVDDARIAVYMMYNHDWGRRYEIEGIGPGSDPYHFSCQLCEGDFSVDKRFVHRHVCQAGHNKKRVEVFEKVKAKILLLLDDHSSSWEELMRLSTVHRSNARLQEWAIQDLVGEGAVEAYREEGSEEVWLERVLIPEDHKASPNKAAEITPRNCVQR